MEETQNRATAARNSSSSRFGIRGGTATGGGEIVEVQGGHIVRSTGRKDRHSKVCTAKGPRDRRVRLSAHTAIQFYDVQDRLGYDRPSKAVDWLIKKAKVAIDELAELPPWNPAQTLAAANSRGRRSVKTKVEREGEGGGNDEFHFGQRGNLVGNSSDIVVHENLQSIENLNDENPNSNFLPPSLDSDSIADTIKSFFPMGAASTDHHHHTPSSSLQFQSFPPDLLSRTTSHTQDLRLSLQSFQEPSSLLHHHHHPAHSQVQQNQNEQFQVYFSGATPLGFDTSESEISRFQRMIAWNANSDGGNNGIGSSGAGATGGGGEFMFNSQPPQQQPQQPLLFGQSQYFNSQRGPLQSSNSPSVRAWIDQPIGLTSNDHHHHHHHHHQFIPPNFHHPMISSIGFAPSMGGFSGFHIPARIQGENEDQHDSIHHNKPSSASSDSCH